MPSPGCTRSGNSVARCFVDPTHKICCIVLAPSAERGTVHSIVTSLARAKLYSGRAYASSIEPAYDQIFHILDKSSVFQTPNSVLSYLLHVATISSKVGLIFKEMVSHSWFSDGIFKASLSLERGAFGVGGWPCWVILWMISLSPAHTFSPGWIRK